MVKDSEASIGLTETRATAEDHKRSLPYIATVASGTVIWTYILTKRVNRMLIGRYSNIVYQIRRAESISNRYTAFKFFTIGGAVVPTVVLAAAYLVSSKGSGKEEVKNIRGEAVALSKATSHSIYRYTSDASRRLEHIAEGVKGTLVPEGIPRMGEELRKDITALKRWLKNIF